MLKFLLSDITNEVIAIELEKLKDISLDVVHPGSKIKLKGPIEVRRGIYMLKNHNIELVWANRENIKMVTNASFNNASNAIL
jgi:hypothetical protein